MMSASSMSSSCFGSRSPSSQNVVNSNEDHLYEQLQLALPPRTPTPILPVRPRPTPISTPSSSRRGVSGSQNEPLWLDAILRAVGSLCDELEIVSNATHHFLKEDLK